LEPVKNACHIVQEQSCLQLITDNKSSLSLFNYILIYAGAYFLTRKEMDSLYMLYHVEKKNLKPVRRERHTLFLN